MFKGRGATQILEHELRSGWIDHVRKVALDATAVRKCQLCDTYSRRCEVEITVKLALPKVKDFFPENTTRSRSPANDGWSCPGLAETTCRGRETLQANVKYIFIEEAAAGGEAATS